MTSIAEKKKWRLGTYAFIGKFLIAYLTIVVILAIGGLVDSLWGQSSVVKALGFVLAIASLLVVGFIFVPKYCQTYVEVQPQFIRVVKRGRVLVEGADVVVSLQLEPFGGLAPVVFRKPGDDTDYRIATVSSGQRLQFLRLSRFVASLQANGIAIEVRSG